MPATSLSIAASAVSANSTSSLSSEQNARERMPASIGQVARAASAARSMLTFNSLTVVPRMIPPPVVDGADSMLEKLVIQEKLAL